MDDIQLGGSGPRTANAPVFNGTDIYFPVETRPAEVDGKTVPGYVAVVRGDTGRVFGFQTSDYRLVLNAEIYPRFDEAVDACGVNVEGMLVDDQLAYGGARTIRTYRFPCEQVAVQVGDAVVFELRVLNSYDGSVAVSAVSGARRLVCLNGMTLGTSFRIYGRHTKGFGVQGLAERLQAAWRLYREGTQRFMEWVHIRIRDEHAKDVFIAMPGITDARLEKLMGYWRNEARSHGQSVWALVNAATYWATHERVRRPSQGNRAAIVLQRESLVQRMVESDAFKRLTVTQ